MAGAGLSAKLWCALLVLAALALHPAARAEGGVGTYYTGFDYMYTRVESYSSILGGRVQLLQPAGFDYYPLDWVPWAVLVEGEISVETCNAVYNLLKANPKIGVVYLNSPGGDLFAGMVLGAMLHDRGLTAVVNVGSECESACALALLGGSRRLVFGDNERFGFHRQYYIVNGKIAYGNWAKDVARLRKYLDAVGAKSISAEEIVSTTQLITYSDERLKERGLTTATRNEIWDAEAREVSEDRSPFEVYLALCHITRLEYTCRINPETQAPLRQPMLLVWFATYPFKPDAAENRRAMLAVVQFFDNKVFVPENGFDGLLYDVIRIECRKGAGQFVDLLERREAMIAAQVQDASQYVKRRDDYSSFCNTFAAEKKSEQQPAP